MDKELVSVVIPTYNRANVIADSIYSVLNQTYSSLEVIIVDDCSSDDTESIIKKINDSRIKYIKLTKNRGACVARNTGIRCAIGEILAFHDSDDIWKPNKLEIEVTALNKNKADVVFCAINRHNYNNCDEIFPVLQEGFKTHKEIVEGFFVSTQTIVGRKKVFEKYQFDENVRRMQDYDLMIRIAETEKVYFVNQALVDVYLQENSISSMTSNQYVKIRDVTKLFLDKYPEFGLKYPKWKIEMYSRLGHCLVMLNEDAVDIYKEIMRIEVSRKNCTKYLLCRLHLLKSYFVLLEKIEGFKKLGEKK